LYLFFYITLGGGRNILQTIKRRKANWIGHILRRTCLLKHVTGGKIKGRIEVTGPRGRRRKQLLDYLKEARGYCELKEKAVDLTLWETRFGRVYGPAVKKKWMTWNELEYFLFKYRLSYQTFNSYFSQLHLKIACLIYTSFRHDSDVSATLKMDAWGTDETLVKTHQTGRFHRTKVTVAFRGPVFKIRTTDRLLQWWISWLS
jgi:hypothetical protein